MSTSVSEIRFTTPFFKIHIHEGGFVGNSPFFTNFGWWNLEILDWHVDFVYVLVRSLCDH